MTNFAEHFAVEDNCPDCGRLIRKTVAWLEDHDVVVCDCGTEMKIDPAIVARFRNIPKFGYSMNQS